MNDSKRVTIGARPSADPHANAWVRRGERTDVGKAELHSARLTVDVTPALRACIKVAAFTQDITVAEMLRNLLEREFPEKPA